MKPVINLSQLESRFIKLIKSYTTIKDGVLDASTHGWSFCAVGLKLKEVGIDIDVAKIIIADHHDVYLNKDNPCSRTIDGHYELDPFQYYQGRQPFQPKGAVDGKVTDSALAKTFGFWGRWGNSSGIPFDADKFLEEHIQWGHLKGYLKDRPSQPWTLFHAGGK